MDKTNHMQGDTPAPENQRERTGEPRPSRHKFKTNKHKPARFAKTENRQSHSNGGPKRQKLKSFMRLLIWAPIIVAC